MRILKYLTVCIVLIPAIMKLCLAKEPDFTRIPTMVDFSGKLHLWDGFGVNYVETSQTFDYEKWSQDYGSFSILSEDSKKEIIDLIFGENGLQPDLVKMFLDPLHQDKQGDPMIMKRPPPICVIMKVNHGCAIRVYDDGTWERCAS